MSWLTNKKELDAQEESGTWPGKEGKGFLLNADNEKVYDPVNSNFMMW